MSTSTYYRSSSHSQLPGEVGDAFHGYPAYPAYPPYPASGPFLVKKEEPDHELVHATSAKRRSPYHPYPGAHEATRSPTRSKIAIPGSKSHGLPSYSGGYFSTCPVKFEEIPPSFNAASWSHVHGDIPQGVYWDQQSRVTLAAPVAPLGPTNCVRVPQGMFDAPLSAGSVRSPDIPFQGVQCPELGIRVGDDELTESWLEGARNFELAHRATEKKLIFRIMWPGYEHFEFDVYVKSELNHFFTAQMLQMKMKDLRKKVKSGDIEVDYSRPAPQWKISTDPRDSGINLDEVFITKLVHRGGSHWQLELWVPKPRIAARY